MIIGEKVTLTGIEKKDLEQLREWRNRREFQKHYRQYAPLTTEGQEKWFDGLRDDQNTIMFAIRSTQTDKDYAQSLLGACGLTYIQWKNRIAEISLYIGHRDLYLDNMYAPETWKLLVEYGFGEVGMHKLWVECYEYDRMRILLCGKFGFHLDGVLRDHVWRDGRYWNSHIYSLLYPEWQAMYNRNRTDA